MSWTSNKGSKVKQHQKHPPQNSQSNNLTPNSNYHSLRKRFPHTPWHKFRICTAESSTLVSIAVGEKFRRIPLLWELLTPGSTDAHVIVVKPIFEFKSHRAAIVAFLAFVSAPFFVVVHSLLYIFYFNSYYLGFHRSCPSCPRCLRRATLRRITRAMTCSLLSMGMFMISPSSRMTIPVCLPANLSSSHAKVACIRLLRQSMGCKSTVIY